MTDRKEQELREALEDRRQALNEVQEAYNEAFQALQVHLRCQICLRLKALCAESPERCK